MDKFNIYNLWTNSISTSLLQKNMQLWSSSAFQPVFHRICIDIFANSSKFSLGVRHATFNFSPRNSNWTWDSCVSILSDMGLNHLGWRGGSVRAPCHLKKEEKKLYLFQIFDAFLGLWSFLFTSLCYIWTIWSNISFN